MSKRTHYLWGFLRTAILMLFSFLPVLGQVSQSTDPSGGTNAAASGEQTAAASSLQQAPGVPARPRLHIVPLRDPNGSNAAVGMTAPPGAQLSYFGGPVISNVHVVQVLYGNGSYNAQVAGTASPTMGNFYSDLTGLNSGYTSLLTQYNTTISGGTNQTIGNGTFDGLFQIVPSAGNNGSTITDNQIQSELLAQITAGHLPAPVLDAAGNVNTLYMIFFPPGTTITQGGSPVASRAASALITAPRPTLSIRITFFMAYIQTCRAAFARPADAAPLGCSATTRRLPATN